MSNLDFKQFSRRHRPHIHQPDATLFVTYRLAGSIPQSTLNLYRAKKRWLEDAIERSRRLLGDEEFSRSDWQTRAEQFAAEWFLKFEDVLHQAKTGPRWLQNPKIADTVAENLHRLDNDAYRLDAYTVMSNHVHTVFHPFLSEHELQKIILADVPLSLVQRPSLAKIMHSLKGRSARESNLILNRSGQFWEHESFDHIIRPGKFDKTIRYVLNNPVKAGMVNDWRAWPWNYCRRELSDKL